MPLVTSTTVPPEVREYFDRLLLRRALPRVVHSRVAQRRPLRMRSGDTIKFRRYGALPLALAPLTEGVAPTGDTITFTDVTGVVKQYGSFIPITDLAQAVIQSPILNEGNRLIAEQASQSLDAIARDVFVAGTNVVFGGGAANRAALTTTTHKIDTPALDRAIRSLNNNNASHFTELIEATVNISTFPIRPAYWAIVHPDVLFTLENLAGYRSVQEYSQLGPVMNSEVGAYKNIRFLLSTQARVFLGGGGVAVGDVRSTGGNADVYATLVFGMEAVGTVPLDGMSLMNIIHLVGEAGSADPLNQRSTTAWKFTGIPGIILNDNFMVRIETTAGLTAP